MIGKTISHYKIVDKLGEGGMGAVYKAEDTALGRLVAIKALSSHLAENDEARERFVREAQAASSLNHANITTVYELLEDEGEQFIVMEYVDGKTIRDVVESSRVSIRKAVDILIQAAEALGAAHNKGILHRDVKSANIMVSMEGNVKVMDFGLAHLEDRSQLTRTGTTMGTLAYSSPEQLVGAPVDRRSEIFSLGVVFYELLTGQLPFKSPSEGELVFEIINTEQEMLTTCREDVPENVCSVVNKMLIKKPELRYQTCGELLTDLKAIRSELETTTVQISGVGTGRNRARTRTIVGVIVGAVAALTAFYFLVLAVKPAESPYLAILPFININQSADDDFADAIALDANVRLSGLDGIKLKDIGSTFQYADRDMSAQEIGLELEAEYCLTAILQWFHQEDGITVQIQPQLILVSDASTLWTDTFREDFTESLSLSASIAERIASAVVEQIAPQHVVINERGTDNDEAWRLYLQGLEFSVRMFRSEHSRFSIQKFEAATELDDTFAVAWTALTHARLWHGRQHGSRQEMFADAQESLEQAFSLEPDLPETHLEQGYWYYWGLSDYDKALEEFEIVLTLRPNNAAALAGIGYIRRRQGRWEEAKEYVFKAHESNPLLWERLFALGQIYLWTREYEKAEEYLERAINAQPEMGDAYRAKALLYLLWEGNREKAQSVVEAAPASELYRIIGNGAVTRARILARNLPEFYSTARRHFLGRESYGYLLCDADAALSFGQGETAVAIYKSARDELESYLPDDDILPFNMAIVMGSLGITYAGLSQKDDAIRIARQGVEIGSNTQDAHSYWRWHYHLAETYTMVDEYDLAIDQLEYLLTIPALVSPQILSLDPIWAPLRDNPRFQALLRKYR